MAPDSLYEIVRNDDSTVYFGNPRTVAENNDLRFSGNFWLVDLLVKPRDGRYVDIALGWYAIHCIMDDFGELVCDEFDFIAREAADNLRAWEFAVVIDGNFNICVGDW